MNIPEEVADAAADTVRLAAWGYITPEEAAKQILEAAVPYMLADAWDEGRKHGATYPYGQRGLATDDNPYRSAK